MNIFESMGMERCKWKRSCVVRMGSRIITRVLLNCLLWGISKLCSKKIFVEVSSQNLKLYLHLCNAWELMTKTLCLDVENSEFRLVPSSGIHFTQLVDRINIPVTFYSPLAVTPSSLHKSDVYLNSLTSWHVLISPIQNCPVLSNQFIPKSN